MTNLTIEKYGNIDTSKASLNLLFYFVLRKLKYLSGRNDQEFEKIANWASETIGKVADARASILSLLQVTFNDNLVSASGSIFKLSSTQKNYYSKWYSGQNNTDDSDESQVPLIDATCEELLYHIFLKLDKTKDLVNKKSNSQYDFYVLERMEELSNLFKNIHAESKNYIAQTPPNKIAKKIPSAPRKERKYIGKSKMLNPTRLFDDSTLDESDEKQVFNVPQCEEPIIIIHKVQSESLEDAHELTVESEKLPTKPVMHYSPAPVVHYSPPPIVHYSPQPMMHHSPLHHNSPNPYGDPYEMVEVKLFNGFVNGSPSYTTCLMTRAQYATVPKV